MDVRTLRAFERMSPFEIKDELIRLARTTARNSTAAFLNAGRGNPNWVATRPRDAFFLLGQFALCESRRVMDLPAGLGGMPQAAGIAARYAAWLDEHADRPGADFLKAILPYAEATFGFSPDDFIHELVDATIGDNYPVPDRMLAHNERITHEYLLRAMCGEPRPAGRFDLFATEGGTAAICYVFKSLKANRILLPGDTIALGTPIFTPYLEMTALEDYGLKVAHVQAAAEDRFQYADAELAKLEDPRVKAFFLVNPGNPTAVAMSPATIGRIAAIVRTSRPDLILLTDDVYCTFVEGFRSLLGELPHNTIGVYSYSKYFGCTGWRLGVIALHEDNILDRMLAAHPEEVKRSLDERYAAMTLEPRALRMIDRIVADSRDVAFNHTAGLSLPQQAMMTLFSLSELMDAAGGYRQACTAILRRRAAAMMAALGIDARPNPLFDHYYGLVDLEFWMRTHLGEEVVEWMKRNVHPLDIVFRLAEEHGIVLLNGGGFHAPDWSARISFANLPDDVYDDIGRALHAVAREYHRAYLAGTGAS